MSDYEKAIAALTKAGAIDRSAPFEDECWVLDRPDAEWLIYPDEDAGDARLVVSLSDLPTLLSPITLEKIDDAFWETLNIDRCGGLENVAMGDLQRFYDAFIARLKGDA